jgi:hypothetical protein
MVLHCVENSDLFCIVLDTHIVLLLESNFRVTLPKACMHDFEYKAFRKNDLKT